MIASAHGGLVESVDDGVTGRLVPPSDPAALRASLLTYVDDRALMRRHGEAGRERFEERFTDEASDRLLVTALQTVAQGG